MTKRKINCHRTAWETGSVVFVADDCPFSVDVAPAVPAELRWSRLTETACLGAAREIAWPLHSPPRSRRRTETSDLAILNRSYRHGCMATIG